MRPFRDVSINKKLTVLMMLTSSAALLVACAAFIVYESLTFRRSMPRSLTTLAEIIGTNSRAALTFQDPAAARDTLAALAANPRIEAAWIYGKDGAVLATYRRPDADRSLRPPALQPDGFRFGENRLVLFHRIFFDSEPIGTVCLVSDLKEMRARLERYASIVGLVLLGSLLAAFAISARLQRVVSAPLLRLARTARRISAERTYSVRAVKEADDELGQLIDGFNEMLSEIQLRDDVLRRVHDGLEQRVEERTRQLQEEVLERQQAEATIKRLAYHDALTGLPNRVLFDDRLTVGVARARRDKLRLAVLFLDLDRFKLINDTMGHTTGDDFLKRVADQLSSLVREVDTVARFGGDEFSILLPGLGTFEDVVVVAQRILDGIRQTATIGGREFPITASLGIALYPDDGGDAQTLLRNADIAMYRAKEQGRNNYQFYTEAMNATILARLDMENDLRRALPRGEFVVHYQPRVDADTRRLVSVEALVRWRHPTRGLVPPAEFIDLAEDSGLIVPLGEWVTRTACAQSRAWKEAGFPPLLMAVNLSARQFQQPDLVDTVERILSESGLEPRELELEITEGAAMVDVEYTVAALTRLKAMGVKLAIDDFGVGYSSLSYLKRFPIDTLKIDQSFVRDIGIDPGDTAIVTTIMVLAQSLNMKIVAEGVETEEQMRFLIERGCHEVQGYLFGRPGPVDSIEKILKRGDAPLG